MKTKNLIKNVGALSLTGYLLLSNFSGVTSVSAAAGFSDTLDVQKIATYSTGLSDEDGGVAEIVKYNADNQKFYVINGKLQTIDIVDLSTLQSGTTQELTKEKSINIADAVNSATFQYGDLTSIDINTKKQIIAAAVQDEDYTKNGRIIIMDYDGNILESFEAGVQPDNVEFTEDGKHILAANEAEPRLGLENGIDPNGSITIVDYDTKTVNNVLFDDTSVIDEDVHIRNNGTLADAIHDLEPEYISLTKDGKKAYVSLQENNAIATINVETGKVIAVKSLGYKDHSLPQNTLDAARNDKIELEQLPILGAYMPDSIAVFEKNGVNYLLTANEGDATEWEEFVNIEDFKKVKDDIQLDTSLFKGLTTEEAEAAFEKMKNSGDYDKLEVLTDRGNDAIYTLGGRSFTIWNADSMEVVYDSGNEFETITAERLPDYFNWSNDDDAFEKRSAKKGPEPEDIKVGMIGNEIYAFIGLERISGVMTYNITDPSNATFTNYINTRDFSSKVAGDVAPEGQDFISAENSPTGKPLLIVGNEVSGTVAINEYQVDPIVPIEIITLNQTSSTLEVGSTLQLTATITPDNTTDSKDLNWTTSNENVATVDANGVVTAIASGTATITAETADKKHKAEATITVAEKTVTEDSKDETPVTDGDQTPEQPENNTKPVTTPEQTDNTTTTPKNNESKSTGTDTTKTQNAVSTNGNALPNTATSNYSLMLYGGVLLLIGGVVYYLNFRLRKE
ncbi:choice-of-anchor I family protein [Bacillus sp. B1-b2]|uniref:choice-of-anchor I family protein n=1 Tax=Bacillus sp. B1-b2 TaxID=2653201 RepID=UPI00126224FA|nr:choice-of-anchor I family protein [Bacillus sp. B1-b2]KAB7667790.1 Ig domain-containing protein [Bacillus sp. B1-b2]